MSQMNPEEAFHNTESSVQLPYKAGLSKFKSDNSNVKLSLLF